ncbi:MSC_0620 family F1-like ATPase-associated subunit [Mycoplasma buteonis]|uniref:MSC_0620 family F1-like ATPase-associated subunit n=1 Tax=Mycoplasma buteonis TaxID=171280 RepID=UPI00056109B7|nr:hypothetical protein [Mycoplasma buteonis]
MKKINKIVALGIATPVLTSSTLLASAAPGETNDTSDENSNSGKLDPNFSSFKSKTDLLLSDGLEKLIDGKITEYRETAGNLIKFSEQNNKNDRQELVDAVYYQKVADYLEHNKAEILKDPEKYGLYIVAPYVWSTSKQVKTGTVVFKDKAYNNIKIGITKESNYSAEFLKKENVYGTKVNDYNEKNVENNVTKYLTRLSKQFNDVFLNKIDVPRLKIYSEDNAAELSLTTLSFDSNHNGFEISVPKNYETWNDYIRTKIFNRFVPFDLNANQSIQKSDDQEIPTPPIIPDEPVEDPILKQEIQNIPSLQPIIKYEFYDSFIPSKYDEFIEQLKTNPSTLNNKFLFNNPILTRYEYSIKALNKESDKLVATVSITDKLDLTRSREYTQEILKLSSQSTTKSFEASVNSLQKTFFNFYQALGIGENMNFKALANSSLAAVVFNMVAEALKTTTDSEFLKRQMNLAEVNKNSVETVELKESSVYYKEIMNLFLGSLERVDLKQGKIWYNYFDYLVNAYYELNKEFKTSLNEKSRKITIENNFKTYQYDLEYLEKGFETLRNDINLLKGLVNSANFDIAQKFNIYNRIVAQIQKTLINLASLSTEKVLDKSTQTVTNEYFVKAYQEIKELKPIAVPTKKKSILIALGSIFLFIGVLFSVVLAIFATLKKKIKIKMDKKQIFLLVGISVIIILISIILIALGLGGL